jgi:small conductance mechanosensitive channel
MRWLLPAWHQLEKMGRSAASLLPLVLVALLVFTLIYLAARLVESLVRHASNRLGRHQNVGLVLGRLARSAIVFLGILVAVTIVFPSFKVANLVQVLGITSVAIGFAFRDILQNFLAGILLLWTQPFRVGDQIIHEGLEGTVEDIQTRATFIKTYDGRRVVVPNAQLFTNAVTVNTAFPVRRVQHDVGIGVGDDVDTAKRIILEALRTLPDVIEEPAPDVNVVDLADFSVKLRIRWWIKPPLFSDLITTQDAVLKVVKERLIEAGIDLPFPTTQILFHDQTEETDGDRRHQREGWPAGPGPVPRARPAADLPSSSRDGSETPRTADRAGLADRKHLPAGR